MLKTLALAVVVSLAGFGAYSAFAQVEINDRDVTDVTDGAIVIGDPGRPAGQTMRYQISTISGNSYREFAMVDMHTGQCWTWQNGRWKDLGSPVKP